MQALNLARDALEGHDGAGAGVGDGRAYALTGERLRADLDVCCGGATELPPAAADRGDERELITALQDRPWIGVLAVDGHYHVGMSEHLSELCVVGQRVERVSDGGSRGQAQLQRVRTGALAQNREQAHGHRHRVVARGPRMVARGAHVLAPAARVLAPGARVLAPGAGVLAPARVLVPGACVLAPGAHVQAPVHGASGSICTRAPGSTRVTALGTIASASAASSELSTCEPCGPVARTCQPSSRMLNEQRTAWARPAGFS